MFCCPDARARYSGLSTRMTSRYWELPLLECPGGLLEIRLHKWGWCLEHHRTASFSFRVYIIGIFRQVATIYFSVGRFLSFFIVERAQGPCLSEAQHVHEAVLHVAFPSQQPCLEGAARHGSK